MLWKLLIKICIEFLIEYLLPIKKCFFVEMLKMLCAKHLRRQTITNFYEHGHTFYFNPIEINREWCRYNKSKSTNGCWLGEGKHFRGSCNKRINWIWTLASFKNYVKWNFRFWNLHFLLSRDLYGFLILKMLLGVIQI